MSKVRLRAGTMKVGVLHCRTLLLSVFQKVFPALVCYSHTHEVLERPLGSALALFF